jgi:hypothetical protein
MFIIGGIDIKVVNGRVLKENLKDDPVVLNLKNHWQREV